MVISRGKLRQLPGLICVGQDGKCLSVSAAILTRRLLCYIIYADAVPALHSKMRSLGNQIQKPSRRVTGAVETGTALFET